MKTILKFNKGLKLFIGIEQNVVKKAIASYEDIKYFSNKYNTDIVEKFLKSIKSKIDILMRKKIILF